MIAAGTSVMSSQPARNVSGSRAHSTSASTSKKTPVSAAVARPGASGSKVAQGEDERRRTDNTEHEEEEAARRIDPEPRLERRS